MPGTADGLTAPRTLRPPKPRKPLLSVWPVPTVPVVVRSLRQAASNRSAPGTVSRSMPRQPVGPVLVRVAAWAEVPPAAAIMAVAMSAAGGAAAGGGVGGGFLGVFLFGWRV